MQDHTSKHSMDMVTVGERGQVVIPAALREKLQINPGDKLMVFTKHNEMLCLVPASNMRHLVEVLTAQISEMENGTENNAKQEG